jgi:hypothetical protein
MAESTGPDRYGRFYWCVKLRKPLVGNEKEIYVHADRVETKNSMVCFISRDEKPHELNLAIHLDYVAAVFAASVLDGHAVAVEHWEDETQ